ncbi:hypothetical protein KOW79_006657 [Hemibagrus wyckioides]|uniref:Uncharacterized protein n=1 Tax=Hemibagrus wyckioides TaxID=337641 RepID=A0A9D3P047_9TELE|nr:hypothetical protein KOW79_006657 [Hemibagrus wyckioides]
MYAARTSRSSVSTNQPSVAGAHFDSPIGSHRLSPLCLRSALASEAPGSLRKASASLGGLEPPTFRLTAERANQLRHRDLRAVVCPACPLAIRKSQAARTSRSSVSTNQPSVAGAHFDSPIGSHRLSPLCLRSALASEAPGSLRKASASLGGLEPPTFRLTAERANRLRHRDLRAVVCPACPLAIRKSQAARTSRSSVSTNQPSVAGAHFDSPIGSHRLSPLCLRSALASEAPGSLRKASASLGGLEPPTFRLTAERANQLRHRDLRAVVCPACPLAIRKSQAARTSRSSVSTNQPSVAGAHFDSPIGSHRLSPLCLRSALASEAPGSLRKASASLGGLEPPTFRLTAERANQLRHRDLRAVVCPACPLAIRKSQAARTSRSSVSTNQPSVAGAHFDSPIGSHRLSPLCLRSALASEAPGSLRKASASLGGLEPPTFRLTAERANRLRHRDLRAVVCPACPLAIRKSQAARTSRSSVSTNQPSVAGAHFDSPIGSHRLSPLCLRSALASEAPGSLRKASASLGGLEPPTFRLTAERANQLRHRDLRAVVCPACPLAIRKSQAARTSRSSVSTNQPSVAGAHFDSPIGSHRLSPLCLRSALASEAPGSLRKASASLGGLEPPTFRLTAERANRLRHRDLRAVVCPACPLAIRKSQAARTSRSSVSTNQPSVAGAHFDSPIGSHRLSPLCLRSALASEAPGSLRKASASLGGLEPPTFRLTAERANQLRHRDLRAVVCPACPLAIRKSQAARTSRSSVSTNQPSVAGAHFDSPIGSHRLSPLCLRSALASEAPGSLRKASASLGGLEPPTFRLTAERANQLRHRDLRAVVCPACPLAIRKSQAARTSRSSVSTNQPSVAGAHFDSPIGSHRLSPLCLRSALASEAPGSLRKASASLGGLEPPTFRLTAERANRLRHRDLRAVVCPACPLAIRKSQAARTSRSSVSTNQPSVAGAHFDSPIGSHRLSPLCLRSALASEAPGSLRKASASLGGLEPPTFRLTAERANRLRHRDLRAVVCPACPLAIRKSQAARTSRSSVSTNQPSVAGAHFDSPIGSHRLSPLCLRSALASEAPGSLRKASASLGGLEPPTFRLTAERANRLRHRDLRAVVCPACPLAIRKSQAARTSRSSVSTNQPSVAGAHFDSPIGSHRLSPLCLRSALASEAPGSLRKASASLGGLEPPTFRLTAERANRLRHRDLRAVVCPACPLAIRKSQAARTSRSSVSTNQPSVAGAHFDSPIGSHRLSPLCLRSALASEAPGSLRKASASLGGLEPPTFRLTAERANRLRHRDLRAVVCPACPLAIRKSQAARTSRSSVSTNQPSVAGAHFDSPIGSHRLSPLCLRSALASEAPGSLRKASASLGGLEPPTFRLTAERANRLRHRDLRAVVCPACPLAIRKSQAARTSRSSVSTNQPSVAGAHFDSPIGSHRLSPLCLRSALASEAPGSLRKASASLGGLEPPTFRLTAERANRLRHRDLRAVVCPACPLAIRKSQAARTSRSSVSTNQPSVAGAHFDSPIGSHRLSPLCLRSALASEAPGSLRKASASLGGLEPPTFRLTAERANRLRHRDLRAVVCPACPLAIRKSQAARTSRSSVSTNQPSVAGAHFDSPIGSHRLSPLCLRSALASEAPGSLRKASASLGGLEPPTFRLTAERANRLRHRDLRAVVCPACPLAIRKSQAARTSRSSVSTNQPSVAGAHFDSPIGSHRLSPLCLRSALASEAPGSLRKASASLGGLEPPTFRLTAERANRLRHRDLRAVVCPACPLAIRKSQAARTSRSSVSTNQPSVAGAHFDSPIGSHRLSPLCLRSALASEAPGSLRKASASLGGLEPPTFRLTAERANRLRHRDLRAVVCPACPLAIRKSQAARTSRSSVSTNQPSVAGAHFDSPIGSHRLSPLCLRSALASEAPGSLRKASASLGGLEPPTFRLTAERANRLRHRDLRAVVCPACPLAIRKSQAARTSRSSVSTNQPSVAGAHFDSPIGSHRLSPLCLRSALASEAPGSLRKASASLGGLEPPTFRLTAERANRLRHRDLRAVVCPACPLAIRKSQAARTSRSSVSTNQPSVAGAHFDSPIGSHRLSPLCLRSALASEAPGSLRKASASLGGLEPPTFRLTAERANRLRHRDLRAVVCPACPLAIRKRSARPGGP